MSSNCSRPTTATPSIKKRSKRLRSVRSKPSKALRRPMRIGRNVEVRPLGGGFGCLLMLLVSVVASVVLTACINLVVR
jgi:hypothetical protein